jgi:hypothetical protein
MPSGVLRRELKISSVVEKQQTLLGVTSNNGQYNVILP